MDDPILTPSHLLGLNPKASRAPGELKLVYYQDAKDIACAVIKVTADRKELYLVSLRRSNQKELDKVIASGKGERWS